MSERITIARPYAKAVFRYAREQNDFASWQNMLIAAGEVMRSKEVREYLSQPGLTSEAQSTWLQDLLKGQLNDPAIRFLDLLAKNGRLDVLPDVSELYQDLQNEAQDITAAEVTSSHPLSDDVVEKLRASLVQKYSGQIELTQNIDPGLIGGAVVRVGDEVTDGSVRGKLNQLKQTLLN